MKIDSYRFGEVIINGEKYTSDVIIFLNHVKGNWWRKNSHLLLPEDLDDVIKENPEVLIVGTGNEGRMKVPAETEVFLKSKGIQVIIQKTEKACKTFNEFSSSRRKSAAALHLTC